MRTSAVITISAQSHVAAMPVGGMGHSIPTSLYSYQYLRIDNAV
jgi:hypothetical protein